MKRAHIYIPVAMLFFTVGSVGTMLWSNAFAQDASKEKIAPPNVKWEYKVVSEITQPVLGLNAMSIEGSLNLLGQEGWECIGTIGEVKGGGSNEGNMTNAVLIFKRLKK